MLLFLFDSLRQASVLKYWSGNFNLNLWATAATIMFITVFDWLSMIPLSWFILSGLYLFCHFYLGQVCRILFVVSHIVSCLIYQRCVLLWLTKVLNALICFSLLFFCRDLVVVSSIL